MPSCDFFFFKTSAEFKVSSFKCWKWKKYVVNVNKIDWIISYRLIKEKWGKSNDRVREKLLVFIGQIGRDAKQVPNLKRMTECPTNNANSSL
jgi:hypothetical protein